MKPAHRLQSRFILAGFLIVAATVGSSLWSAWTFVRLSVDVDRTLLQSREVIDLGAALHGSLEREDDALLLFLSGDTERAIAELNGERLRGDRLLDRLAAGRGNDDSTDRRLVRSLQDSIEQYRRAGDELLSESGRAGGLERYHRRINPLLREAVAGCDRLRETNFRSIEDSGLRVRDEAIRGTRWVLAISLLTVSLGIGVAVWLARSVLGPIGALTRSVAAIREGNFDQRVGFSTNDELGQLALGFDRMSEALSEYRRSSLGELLTAKTTLEATLDALPDAVMVFGPDGKLDAINPLARTILAARDWAGVTHLAEIPFSVAHRSAIDAAVAGRMPRSTRFDFEQTLDVVIRGQTKRFMVTAVPIAHPNTGRFGAAVVLDDVTEFVRLDELRSELIGVASHELKSPLTALRMNLLMLGESADEMGMRQRTLVTAAIEGCEELGLTIEELLDVTRIEAGQLKLNLMHVDAGSILTATVRALQPRFDDAGLRLRLIVPPGQHPIIADAVRLRSVLTNLLSNAQKYSPPGGEVVVELATVPSPDPKGASSLEISVTDRGPGIPDEYLERIFEKFFRVEHQRGQVGTGVRGTGIGLYLCREIMKAHGGSIIGQSLGHGKGTRIRIAMPIDGGHRREG